MKQAAAIIAGLAILVVAGLALYGPGNSQVTQQDTPEVTQETSDTTQQTPPAVDNQQTTPLPPSTSTNETETMNQELLAITHTAAVTTNQGNFTLSLYGNATPNTVQNFVNLAQDGFYNDTKFHRIIEGFMIQGGDPQTKDDSLMNAWGTGGPGYQFDDEIVPELSNVTGTIAMANAGPNTNGSQFFINVADNVFLNGWDASTPSSHTVFGLVTEGYDVVEMLSQVGTEGPDRPIDPVIIESVVISEVAAAPQDTEPTENSDEQEASETTEE